MLGFNSINFLDPPDVDQTNFGPDMKRWLSNVVDTVNDNFLILSSLTEYFESLITSNGIDVGGAGPGPINVTVIGLTPSGYVTATLISSTNPTSILSVVPNLNFFSITFSSDPGASAICQTRLPAKDRDSG